MGNDWETVRLPGVGFQEQASNHFKLLQLRAVVVSVEGKVARELAIGVDQRDEGNRTVR